MPYGSSSSSIYSDSASRAAERYQDHYEASQARQDRNDARRRARDAAREDAADAEHARAMERGRQREAEREAADSIDMAKRRRTSLRVPYGRSESGSSVGAGARCLTPGGASAVSRSRSCNSRYSDAHSGRPPSSQSYLHSPVRVATPYPSSSRGSQVSSSSHSRSSMDRGRSPSALGSHISGVALSRASRARSATGSSGGRSSAHSQSTLKWADDVSRASISRSARPISHSGTRSSASSSQSTEIISGFGGTPTTAIPSSSRSSRPSYYCSTRESAAAPMPIRVSMRMSSSISYEYPSCTSSGRSSVSRSSGPSGSLGTYLPSSRSSQSSQQIVRSRGPSRFGTELTPNDSASNVGAPRRSRYS